MHSQTSFENARGISAVEVTAGHSLIIVSGVFEFQLTEKLLEGLRALNRAEMSFDFLKLAPHGFSFVVPEAIADKAVQVLCAKGLDARASIGRSIVTVRAPNIRDESGLVARIAQMVVNSGATIEHVGDMHSSVQMVVTAESAEAAAAALKDCIGKAEIL